jgi:hypothetical protein
MTMRSVGVWLKDNQHWVGPAGILIGVIVSAYFYFASREVGEVSLKFNTVKIFQVGVPSIKIFDRDNNQIVSNVFGCEIIIWNTGNLTLGDKSDRVREPLTVTLSSEAKIIDLVIQDTKNVTANAIKLDRHENRIAVIWSQFDPGDAIKIFVIYASASQSPINYRGRSLQTRFLDVSAFEQEYPVRSAFFSVAQYNLERKPYVMAFVLLSLLLISCLVICILIPAFRRKTRSIKFLAAVFAASVISNLIATILDYGSDATPFR